MALRIDARLLSATQIAAGTVCGTVLREYSYALSPFGHRLATQGIHLPASLPGFVDGDRVRNGNSRGGAGIGTSAISPKLSGFLHGGQQPVSGSYVFLYAIGSTDGESAQSLLTTSGGYVTTDANGNRGITGAYTCPANAYAHVLALRGNPGLAAGTNNPALALASVLGQCSSLSSGQFFVVNEIITAVAASALAGLATSETQISSSDLTAVANAVSRNNSLIDPAHGSALSVTPDRTGSVPTARINSLADSLAACVNSDGTINACKTLMNASGLQGNQQLPQDTFNAALYIAQTPARDPSDIYNLATSSAPFEPALANSPHDWTLQAQYSGEPYGSGVSLTPDSATIVPGAQVTLTASGSGSGGPPSVASYRWTTSGALGTLSDNVVGDSNQNSFCIPFNQVTYKSNGSSVTGSSSDTVKVLGYTLGDCSGAPVGAATAAIYTVPSAASSTFAGQPTNSYAATVVLPSGVNLPLDSLSVIDSISQTTPDSSGNFTLPEYTGVEQVVVVNGPDGTPILLGWMDGNHPTVDESTTAEVLAFYAFGGPNVTAASDRAILISQIPQQNGFGNLVQAIDTELNNSVDAFAQPNADVTSALNALFTQVTGFATAARKGSGLKVSPNDVTVTPDSSTPQSGVSISTVQPSASSGYTTTSAITPWSTFLTKAYRRRTHHFVTKQKDTLNGQDYASNAAVTDADVSPTAGLNGGVSGALSDIIQAYFGNQPTAYAPVTTDPFDLPVDSGYDSTTYQIINVGAGGSGAPFPVQLTSTQFATLQTTAVNGFVQDALIPFLANVVIAGNQAEGGTAHSSAPASPFVEALETNIGNVVNAAASAGTQAKIVAGDYKGALEDVLFSATFSTATVDAIQKSIIESLPLSAATGVATQAFAGANKLLSAAGAGLQVLDTVVYGAQILSSDNVDLWTVTSTNSRRHSRPRRRH